VLKPKLAFVVGSKAVVQSRLWMKQLFARKILVTEICEFSSHTFESKFALKRCPPFATIKVVDMNDNGLKPWFTVISPSLRIYD